MIPKDEGGSVVWSDEMAKAFGAAAGLLAEGDKIGARMAFKETYANAVQKARDDAIPGKWTPSYGWDKSGRVAALREAQERGRLPHDKAVAMIEKIAPESAQLERMDSPQLVGDVIWFRG